MKQSEMMLPAELLWEDDGHLTEVVLEALADAQDGIVPSPAHAHLDGCDRCLRRLGEAATRSAECGAALVALDVQKLAEKHAAPASMVPSSGRASRAPRYAISAGLLLATLGTLPFLFNLPAFIADVSFFFSRGAPIMLHMLSRFFVSASSSIDRAVLILPGAAALVLVMAGVLVARSLPRSLSVSSAEGEVSV
jgi:hypothetical protein